MQAAFAIRCVPTESAVRATISEKSKFRRRLMFAEKNLGGVDRELIDDARYGGALLRTPGSADPFIHGKPPQAWCESLERA
jgi:hypothetical protein